jgi:hypothetical protein
MRSAIVKLTLGLALAALGVLFLSGCQVCYRSPGAQATWAVGEPAEAPTPSPAAVNPAPTGSVAPKPAVP